MVKVVTWAKDDEVFKTYSKDEYDRRNWETCSVGEYCIAYWQKSMTWNNARIKRVEGENVKIKFFNYGTKANVRIADIVWSPTDIPEGEAVDCHVASLKQTEEIPLDRKCQAHWKYDNTWKNAKIIAIQRSGIRVKFSNCGSEEWVKWKKVVWHPVYIPEGEWNIPSVKTWLVRKIY